MRNVWITKPFDVKITLDASNVIRAKNMGENGSKWSINVSNPTNQKMIVVYNAKMCFEGDAKLWKGLNDIKTVTIPANGSSMIDIEKNGTASSIAICHTKGGARYITYADDLSGSSLSPQITTISSADYGSVNLVGKNANKWIINVTNTYNERVKVEFNRKMCFESDARNWTGINEVSGL